MAGRDMTAVKAFKYNNRMLKAGERFVTVTERDAKLLNAARRAKDAPPLPVKPSPKAKDDAAKTAKTTRRKPVEDKGAKTATEPDGDAPKTDTKTNAAPKKDEG